MNEYSNNNTKLGWVDVLKHEEYMGNYLNNLNNSGNDNSFRDNKNDNKNENKNYNGFEYSNNGTNYMNYADYDNFTLLHDDKNENENENKDNKNDNKNENEVFNINSGNGFLEKLKEENENEKLKKENEELKKETEKLKKENEEWRQKFSEQTAQIEYIFDMNTDAANERDASEKNLKRECDKLKDRNSQLQRLNDRWKICNQSLRNTNYKLDNKNLELEENNRFLNDKNSELESKNNDLKDQLMDLASSIRKQLGEHLMKRNKDLVFGVVPPSIGIGAFIVLLTCSLSPMAFFFTGIIGVGGLAPTIIDAIRSFISGKEEQIQEILSQYQNQPPTQDGPTPCVTPQYKQDQAFNNDINNNNDSQSQQQYPTYSAYTNINNNNNQYADNGLFQNQYFNSQYPNQMYNGGMNMNNGQYQPMVSYEQSNVNNYPIINQ